jgi:(S)-sulfolactate dehydrogenase
MRIVISEFMDEAAVAWLRERRPADDVLYEPDLVDRPADLARRAAPADALIVRNRTQVRGALLQAMPALRVVGRLGVGLDNIDVDACRARGIAVLPATGANADAVAEYVIASAMLLLRGAFGATAAVGRGDWPRTTLSLGREIGGKTLGLVGFGDIGRRVARRALALGMSVIAFDPQLDAGDPVWAQTGAAPATLGAVVAGADVLSLHVPLTDATRALFDAGRLAQMKPGAVLINTARGGIVDEDALAQALRAGTLAGAALDVFDVEPHPASSRWQGLCGDAGSHGDRAGPPRLLLTPHIAGVTAESNQRVSFMVAERVAESLERGAPC